MHGLGGDAPPAHMLPAGQPRHWSDAESRYVPAAHNVRVMVTVRVRVRARVRVRVSVRVSIRGRVRVRVRVGLGLGAV